MRGVGVAFVLIAGALGACRSPPLVRHPRASAPNLAAGEVLPSDATVAAGPAVGRSSGPKRGEAVSSHTLRADRNGPGSPRSDRLAVGVAQDRPATGSTNDVADRVSPHVRHALLPAPALAPEATGAGEAIRAVTPTPPAGLEGNEPEAARSGRPPTPWPWPLVAGGILLLTGLWMLRRHLARGARGARRFDAEEAWSVFQAGLARRPGEGDA